MFVNTINTRQKNPVTSRQVCKITSREMNIHNKCLGIVVLTFSASEIKSR